MALATAAVTKYAADSPPIRLRVLTVQGSKDPSHSLSESHFRERQRVKSWTAKTELTRVPMDEVTKTVVLCQRSIVEMKGEEGQERREENGTSRASGCTRQADPIVSD
jgi:hypothetical protein